MYSDNNNEVIITKKNIMYTVTTTMTNEVSTFNTMNEVRAHIKREITWFNSPAENKNGNGYDETDFLITENN